MTEIELLEYVLGNLKADRPAGYGLLLDGELSTAWSVFDMGLYRGYTEFPRTHMVNDFEVPAPESKKPGGKYFTPDIDHVSYCHEAVWTDHERDEMRLKRNMIHLSAEFAIANAKAMLGINPDLEAE